MNVTYKCECLDEEVTIAVPDRLEGDDVVHWVSTIVGSELFKDHRTRSPDCRSTATQYVKFEIDPAGGPLGTISRS